MFTVDSNTWIISDTHFRHNNIIKYCDRPMNHNELMIQRWNEVVKPEDKVLHLGDLHVWFGERMWEAYEDCRQLQGDKYIIRGNHDRWKASEVARLGFTEVPEFTQNFGGKVVLFSHYPDKERKFTHNIHGHIHNNLVKESDIIIGRKYINVSVEVIDYTPQRLGDLLG